MLRLSVFCESKVIKSYLFLFCCNTFVKIKIYTIKDKQQELMLNIFHSHIECKILDTSYEVGVPNLTQVSNISYSFLQNIQKLKMI